MKIIKTLLLTIIFSASFASFADNKLRLAAPFFPPYTFFDIDGNIDGIWIQQLTPILNTANIEFTPVHTPVARFFSSIATGKVEISALPKGAKGMSNVLYSDAPFSKYDLRVFWLDDKPDISSIAQLANKKVVLTRGYKYGGFLEETLSEEQRSNFTTANNKSEAIKLLRSGEADYLLGYWALMDYLQKNSINVQLSNKKIYEIPIYFVVHNSAPNAEDVMKRYNAALADWLKTQ